MAFLLDNNHIAVNYHYVEDPRPDAGGIHPCSIHEFDREIAFLSDYYRFASVPEVFEAAKNKSAEKLCAITFDDGLKDQYENAVSILKKYNANATFFVITGTLEGLLPLAYKIHLLTSQVSMEEVARTFNAFVSNSFPRQAQDYLISSDQRMRNRRFHESVLSANVKETLIMIPRDIRNAFFDVMLKGKLKINEAELCRDLFMSREQVATLERDGFIVGNHTHQHESFEFKDKIFVCEDMRVSAGIFSKLLVRQPTVIAYPYGLSNEITAAALKECGLTHGVTIERRAVTAGDNIMRIPRFDSTDVKDFLDANE